MNEPALDLGIVLAILSSYRNRPVDSGTIVFGEVGLTGEVRAVNMAESRVAEAARMGYTACILPESNRENIRNPKLRLIGVRNVRELLRLLGS